MAETLADYRSSSLGELLTAKMTLEATLDALPDAVMVVAPDGRLAALNPPAQRSWQRLKERKRSIFRTCRCGPSIAGRLRPRWPVTRRRPPAPISDPPSS